MTLNEFKQRLLIAIASNPVYGLIPDDTRNFIDWLDRIKRAYNVLLCQADEHVQWNSDTDKYVEDAD